MKQRAAIHDFRLRNAGGVEHRGSNIVEAGLRQNRSWRGRVSPRQQESGGRVGAAAAILLANFQVSDSRRCYLVPGESLVPQHGDIRELLDELAVEFPM